LFYNKNSEETLRMAFVFNGMFSELKNLPNGDRWG